MATKLITDIPVFVFSSQLREIEFETDQDRLIITLEDGLKEIFRTTIYAYDGKAHGRKTVKCTIIATYL